MRCAPCSRARPARDAVLLRRHSARLIEQAGFALTFMSGFAVSARGSARPTPD
jgi:hypothetical protein